MELPEILNIPPKLYPIITNFNDYNYILLEGGRGSAKSQSIARLITYIAENRKVRVCCGRELQTNIDESVKALFEDLILNYNLNFKIFDKRIEHNTTGSEIKFKGFREQGRISIKGLEGVDILWIDEAEAITKETLDIIVPTIRKKNSVVIFTMNRHTRSDAVYEFFAGRQDCLHIKINYFDNPHCPQKLIDEANMLKEKNFREYAHIWLGEPLEQSSDYLFNTLKIDEAKNLKLREENYFPYCVMSVDLAGAGGDLCVAKKLVARNKTQWEEIETITWSEPDTDVTKGKILSLYSSWGAKLLVMDADGMGYPICCSVKKVINNVIEFHGAGKTKQKNAGNQRADGYLILNEFINNGWLKLNDKQTIKQLEYIKKVYKPSHQIFIQEKKEIRKERGESPDFADSLMMGIYAINYHLNLLCADVSSSQTTVQSDFDPFDWD